MLLAHDHTQQAIFLAELPAPRVGHDVFLGNEEAIGTVAAVARSVFLAIWSKAAANRLRPVSIELEAEPSFLLHELRLHLTPSRPRSLHHFQA